MYVPIFGYLSVFGHLEQHLQDFIIFLDESRALLARDKEGEFAAFQNLSNEDTLPGEM
jgi:hypothetical protein